jgi:hypothetical protein
MKKQRFCEETLNPADKLSRGVKASTLEQTNWWTGPQWVTDPSTYNPITKDQKPSELQINEIYINWERKWTEGPFWKEHSTKHRMVREMAWVRRVINSFRGKKVLWWISQLGIERHR